MSNRLDDSSTVPSFEFLEGTGHCRVLLSSFSESTLVRVGLSQAPLDTRSDESSSSSGDDSDSQSGSRGIVPLICFALFLALLFAESISISVQW